MTTTAQLAGITAQHNEIVKRVCNGSLDPIEVKRALQVIIEGKLPPVKDAMPTWWRTPEQQLDRARQLWPDKFIPEPPKDFTPATASEVLLLHVPDTFDHLWDLVLAPRGYTKYRQDSLKAHRRHLRLSPNKREYTQPVWLGFDPEHAKGIRPDSLWGAPNLAASEVLSALIQFTEWPLAWGDGASTPNLSGYQLNRSGNSWTYVPYLHRWINNRVLRLNEIWAGSQDDIWASPTVREC